MTAKAQRQNYRNGIALALLASLFYGNVPILARQAFVHGIPALESVLARTIFISILLGVLALLRRETLSLPKEGRKAFLLQALATLIVSSCYLASVQFIPVAISVIIFFAAPLIVLLFSPMIEGHAPGWPRLLVGFLGFIGLYLAIGPNSATLNPIGLSLAAIAAFGYALQFFSGRMLSRYLGPAAFGSLVHIAIFPIVLIIVMVVGQRHLVLVQPYTFGSSGFIFTAGVCLAYAFGYLFHMSSLAAAPASVVAPFFNLEPIITLTVSVLILGEHLTTSQYAGAFTVLAALVLASQLKSGNHQA
ncbi:MAG: DMT family transporter [Aestuariivirga sp.]